MSVSNIEQFHASWLSIFNSLIGEKNLVNIEYLEVYKISGNSKFLIVSTPIRTLL